MIQAVVFDLDDTLFPEFDYVKSCFAAVGERLRVLYGIENGKDRLLALFEESKSDTIGRLLKENDITDEAAVKQMVDVYREHVPDITLSTDTKETLVKLREAGYKLGIITDGRPNGQRAKIAALGLVELVERIIITDELGGEQFRKPNPKAFEIMACDLGVKFEEMMYVGDNPQKDFAIGEYGVKTVRIMRGGLYSDCEYANDTVADAVIKNIKEVFHCINLLNT